MPSTAGVAAAKLRMTPATIRLAGGVASTGDGRRASPRPTMLATVTAPAAAAAAVMATVVAAVMAKVVAVVFAE
ncbi:hypothetical protein MMPV_001535 [Pyropia vietnamensis]